MPSRLEGKIAVVTGASAGVGRGVAKSFAAEGAHVFLAGRPRTIPGAADGIAKAAVFLASDDSLDINGAALDGDGGVAQS